MGRILHSIDQLPYPLLLTDERHILIPRDGALSLDNTQVKVLLFLRADLEMQISGHVPVRIQSGDILTVPPNFKQTYRSLCGKAERLSLRRILLAPDALKPTRAEGPLLAGCFKEIHHLPKASTPHHHELLVKLREESEKQRPGYRLMAAGICLELVALILREINATLDGSGTKTKVSALPTGITDEHVRGAQEFIIENFEKPLTLDEIAWSVRLSREHLSRIFLEKTGSTVFGYVTKQRIEMAKNHLCESGLAVEEIAKMVGYSSSSLFCRTFRRMVGTTPSAYRHVLLANAGFNPSLRKPQTRKSQPLRRA